MSLWRNQMGIVGTLVGNSRDLGPDVRLLPAHDMRPRIVIRRASETVGDNFCGAFLVPSNAKLVRHSRRLVSLPRFLTLSKSTSAARACFPLTGRAHRATTAQTDRLISAERPPTRGESC